MRRRVQMSGPVWMGVHCGVAAVRLWEGASVKHSGGLVPRQRWGCTTEMVPRWRKRPYNPTVVVQNFAMYAWTPNFGWAEDKGIRI